MKNLVVDSSADQLSIRLSFDCRRPSFCLPLFAQSLCVKLMTSVFPQVIHFVPYQRGNQSIGLSPRHALRKFFQFLEREKKADPSADVAALENRGPFGHGGVRAE